jgi:LysM repeat protein
MVYLIPALKREFLMSLNWLATRICLVMIILIASLSGAPVLAQGAATVRVDPSASSVQVNDTASIAIKVDNIANLTAFELHLSFDPAVLEVTGMTNGGFVAADFTAQNKFDNAAGTIDYAIAQMNRTPAQGNGTLLNIVFRAKGAGSTTVTTRATQAAPDGLLFADQNGIAIQVSWVPGNINVGVGTPTNTDTPPTTAVPTTVVPTTPGPTTPAPTTPVSTTSVPTTPVSTTPVPTTPSPTITPTPGTLGTHVVRWGEWVYCIARAYRVSPWAIIQTNHLWWPYIIFSNQKLIIPNVPWTNIPTGPVCKAQFTVSASTPTPTPTSAATPTPTATLTTSTATPTPTSTVPPSTCRATYVVRSGDTLYGIAMRYGTTYTELARVNGISNPRLIYAGQRLCIP